MERRATACHVAPHHATVAAVPDTILQKRAARLALKAHPGYACFALENEHKYKKRGSLRVFAHSKALYSIPWIRISTSFSMLRSFNPLSRMLAMYSGVTP
jgi:hypothetical protein